jgi:hypothetical protein
MPVFGGHTAGALTTDVWGLRSIAPAWSALSPDGSPPYGWDGYSEICDEARDRMVVCGGIPSPAAADAWTLTLAGPASSRRARRS